MEQTKKMGLLSFLYRHQYKIVGDIMKIECSFYSTNQTIIVCCFVWEHLIFIIVLSHCVYKIANWHIFSTDGFSKPSYKMYSIPHVCVQIVPQPFRAHSDPSRTKIGQKRTLIVMVLSTIKKNWQHGQNDENFDQGKNFDRWMSGGFQF